MTRLTNYQKETNVLVIGASSGIGFSVAKTLSGYMNVTAFARREERLKPLNQFGIQTKSVDVNDHIKFKESVEELVSNKGKITHAIYCSGIQKIKPLRSFTYDGIQQIFQTNLVGPTFLGSLMASKKISNKESVYCIVSSIAAYKPEPGIVPYSVSKAGLDALIKGMALELAPRRFVAVAPGWISTEMTMEYSHIFNEEYIEKLENQSPLGIVKISSIVDAIEFLISKKAKHITGQTLVVDGGSSL